MAANNDVRIEKLGKNNWKTWLFQIKNILRSTDSWEVVTGTVRKPDALTRSSSEAAVASYDAAFKKWEGADKIACKYFATTVGSEALELILNCETAREMYLKLETQYTGATALRKMDVLTSFFNLSYVEGDGMISFKSKVESLLKDIKSTGVVLDDSVVIVRVLTSLLKSYNSFLSA